MPRGKKIPKQLAEELREHPATEYNMEREQICVPDKTDLDLALALLKEANFELGLLRNDNRLLRAHKETFDQCMQLVNIHPGGYAEEPMKTGIQGRIESFIENQTRPEPPSNS